MTKVFIEVLIVYCIDNAESVQKATEKALNMAVGEYAPVIESLTPTGRFLIKK